MEGQVPSPPGHHDQGLLGSRTEVVELGEVRTVLHTAEVGEEEDDRRTVLHHFSYYRYSSPVQLDLK